MTTITYYLDVSLNYKEAQHIAISEPLSSTDVHTYPRISILHTSGDSKYNSAPFLFTAVPLTEKVSGIDSPSLLVVPPPYQEQGVVMK